jgi:hypothetical protein
MNLPPVRLPAAPVQPASPDGAPDPALDVAARVEIGRLRALVAGGLGALARSLEENFGPAIEGARKAWERADDVTIVDRSLAMMLTDTRRALYRATAVGHPTVRAVALEGLLAFDAGCGLTGLAERRLSALIRLRVGSADATLLPGGRPFLDIGRALGEAAREWS